MHSLALTESLHTPGGFIDCAKFVQSATVVFVQSLDKLARARQCVLSLAGPTCGIPAASRIRVSTALSGRLAYKCSLCGLLLTRRSDHIAHVRDVHRHRLKFGEASATRFWEPVERRLRQSEYERVVAATSAHRSSAPDVSFPAFAGCVAVLFKLVDFLHVFGQQFNKATRVRSAVCFVSFANVWLAIHRSICPALWLAIPTYICTGCFKGAPMDVGLVEERPMMECFAKRTLSDAKFACAAAATALTRAGAVYADLLSLYDERIVRAVGIHFSRDVLDAVNEAQA